MTLDVVVGAEVAEPLDRGSAERLDKRIRLLVGTIHDQIAKLFELVAEAKRGNVHVALGFPSWTAYLADVFTVQVRLEREQRRELVGYLSGEGMSNRAIAKLTDTDERTIRRDRVAGAANAAAEPVTGLDGKKYKPKPVDAKPRRGNSKLQIRVLKGTQVQLSAMASALEAAFTGMFDKTCTPDIAHHAALEMRAFIARIDKVLRMLEASR